MKYLDKAANIAILFAVGVFLIIAAQGYRGLPLSRPQQTQQGVMRAPKVGTKFRLPNIKLPLPRPSLVLALSTECHFCKESLPLYKTLAKSKSGKFDLIAVLPQSMDEGRAYLDTNSVHADQVISADLNQIGITGTPTIVLLDPDGTVRNAWIGKLNATQERELFGQVTRD